MSTDSPRRRPGRIAAALLVAALFGLLGAPAAWAGGGGPGTQGKSESNPDGEGVDKPYAAAGQAAMSQGDSDYDGNNGCGNDDDRADDNNGNCGGGNDAAGATTAGADAGDGNAAGKEDASKPSDAAAAASGQDERGKPEDAGAAAPEANVMGVQIERAAAVASSPAATSASETRVLGASIERGQAAALAATGAGLGLLLAVALGLIAAGSAARRFARR